MSISFKAWDTELQEYARGSGVLDTRETFDMIMYVSVCNWLRVESPDSQVGPGKFF